MRAYLQPTMLLLTSSSPAALDNFSDNSFIILSTPLSNYSANYLSTKYLDFLKTYRMSSYMIAIYYKSFSLSFIIVDACFCFLLTSSILFSGFLFKRSSLGSSFFNRFYYSSFLKENKRWVKRGKVFRAGITSPISLNRLLEISS